MGIASGSYENGELIIKLRGRVDSVNAAQAEHEIEALREGSAHTALVLDMDALEYISSAGLRVILRLRKVEPDMVIVNANAEVYDILEMTGFTEMITVTKAFRRVSVDGCEVIGEGANGKVYRLDADTIIKVYKNPDSLPYIKRERELARKAFVMGVPTAIPYDVVRVGSSYGSVFEMLNAKTLAKLMQESPADIDRYINIFADLLVKIHSTHVKPNELPDKKAEALSWMPEIRRLLDGDQADKIERLFTALPDATNMLHGDYHIKNVMMQGDEALLIDMDTLAMGHPVFELAATYLGFVAFYEHDAHEGESFMGLDSQTAHMVWEKTLKRYLGDADEARVREVEDKCIVVCYARIVRRTASHGIENTPDGERWLATARGYLADVLPRVDSLDF